MIITRQRSNAEPGSKVGQEKYILMHKKSKCRLRSDLLKRKTSRSH